MTRQLAILTLAATLGVASAAQAGRGPRHAGFGDDDGTHQIIGQIAAKMLFDGLQLTAQQKTDLARALREHKAEIDAFRGEREVGKDEMVRVLTAARDELYRTGSISPATRQGVVAAHEARRPAAGGEGELQEKKPRMGGDLEALLTPQQLDYLKGFDPMRELGFSREGRRGRRGGAAGEEHGPGHRLERLRELSEPEYAEKRAEILAKLGDRLKARGETESAVAGRTQKLGEKLDMLRSGSDADLDELRGSFDLPGMLHGRGMERRHHEWAHRMLLMSPEFLALLEGRDPLTAAN